MAKNSGTTKASASSNAKTKGAPLSAKETQAINKRLAENFGYAARVDPDDLLYSTLANSPLGMVERAIERNTDYDVVGVTDTTVNVINRNGDPADYVGNDPVHVYEASSKSLVDIIRDLRFTSERKLFNKDFK